MPPLVLEEILSTVVANITNLLPIRKIHSYEQGVKFSFGQDKRLLKTGIHFYIPYIQGIEVRPTVPEVINLPNQSLITRDDKIVCISGAVEYQIQDLRKWWVSVQDFDATLVNTALGYIGRSVRQSQFDDIRTNTGAFEVDVYNKLKEKIDGWGVDLIDFYVTDFAPVKTFRLIGDGTPLLTNS